MRVEIFANEDSDIDVLYSMLEQSPVVKTVGAVYGYPTASSIISGYSEPDIIVFPDVVLIEAKMTGGSVPALIRAMRSVKPMAKTPILVYGDADDAEARHACSTAGATGVFTRSPGAKTEQALLEQILALARDRDRP